MGPLLLAAAALLTAAIICTRWRRTPTPPPPQQHILVVHRCEHELAAQIDDAYWTIVAPLEAERQHQIRQLTGEEPS